MSSMKNLLGDMTFEEFEAKRKQVLGLFADSISLEELENQQVYTGELYRMWKELHGNDLTVEYIEKIGNVDLTWEQIDTGAKMLVDGFISWLESYE